ncbi:MAG TPA: GntR family transcriptional regulator [Trebonia sp.]|nr:GntR family transcriptional regulator [Trebonia sp.]
MTIDKGLSGLAGGDGAALPGGALPGGAFPAGDASATGGRGSRSPIEFRLDPDSGVPTYLQLVQQVEHALRLGYLEPGDQLPKVRDVVAALTINPNTVLKAYKELETKGLAAGRPGQGTFVQATLSQVALPELAGLRRSLQGWLVSAGQAGLDEDGVVALFSSVLRDWAALGPVPAGQRGYQHRRQRDGSARPGRESAGSEGVA